MDKFNSNEEKIQKAIDIIKINFYSGTVTNELQELLAILETPVKRTKAQWQAGQANLPE